MPDVVGTAYVTILPNTAGFSTALSTQMAGATAAASGLGAAAVTSSSRLATMSASLMGVSTKAGLVARSMRGPTIAVGLLAAAGIKTAYDFDTSMRRVQAVTGATKKVMGEFSELAQQLGRDTAFTATQAAEGMTVLALSGFKAKEIIRSLPGVLDLAAAGGVQLSEAAKIATSTLRGFGLQANDVGRVNDVLSSVFTTSTTTVSDLGNAFKYVGPVARAVGIQFEETGAALGILANAGLRGTQGGTALRNIFAKIVNPTGRQAKLIKSLGIDLTDANGKFKTLSDTVDEFNKSGATTQEVLQVFGLRAGPAFLALMQQGKTKIDLYTKAIQMAGNETKAVGAILRLTKKEQKSLNDAFTITRQTVLDLGFNLDDTTGVLGSFIDKGMSAESSAKGLAGAMMLTKKEGFEGLIKASRNLDGALVDSQGNTLTFLDIIMRVKKGGPGVEKMLRAMGDGGIALADAAEISADQLKNLYDGALKAGRGATIARIQLEGIKGALKRLRSSAEQLGITIFGGENGVLAQVAKFADGFAVLINNIDKNFPQLVKFAGFFLLLVGAIGPAAKVVQLFSKALGTMFKLLKFIAVDNPIVGTLILIAAALVGAYKSSEKFRNSIKLLVETFKKLWKKTFGSAQKDVKKTSDKVKEATSIFDIFGKALEFVGDKLATLVNGITKLLVPAFKLLKIFVEQGSKAFTAFKDAFTDGDKKIQNSGFAGAFERIGEAAQTVFEGIKKAYQLFVAPVIDSLTSFFGRVKTIIDQNFGTLFEGTKPEFSWDFIKDSASSIYGALKDSAPDILDAIGRVFDDVAASFSLAESFWPGIWDEVKASLADTPVIRGLADAFGVAVETSLGTGTGLATVIAGAFQGDQKKIEEGGKKIWESLKKGFKDAAKADLSIGKDIGDAFLSGVASLGELDLGTKIEDSITINFSPDSLGRKIGAPLAGVLAFAVRFATASFNVIGAIFQAISGDTAGAQASLAKAGSAIINAFKGVFNFVIPGVIDLAKSIGTGLLDALRSVIDFVGKELPKIIDNIFGRGKDEKDKAAGKKKGKKGKQNIFVSIFEDDLKGFPGWLMTVGFPTVFKSLVSFFGSIGKATILLGGALIKAVFNILKSLILGVLNAVLQSVLGLLNTIWTNINLVLAGWPMKIVNALIGLGNAILLAFRVAFMFVTTQLPIYATSVVLFFTSLPGRILSALGNFGSQLGGYFKTAWDIAYLFFSNGINIVVEKAKGIGSSILGAITGAFGAVGGFAGDIAGSIWGALKGFINNKLLGPIKRFKIPDIIPYFGGKTPFSSIPLIAANGAVVTKATAALIGEAGAEARVPISDIGSLRGYYKGRRAGGNIVDSPTVTTVGRTPEAILPLTRPKRMMELAAEALSMTLRGRAALSDMGVKMLANGDVVRGPVNAIIGEAGPEVVIPLSRPRRAAELVKKSGLMGVLSKTREGMDASSPLMLANGAVAVRGPGGPPVSPGFVRSFSYLSTLTRLQQADLRRYALRMMLASAGKRPFSQNERGVQQLVMKLRAEEIQRVSALIAKYQSAFLPRFREPGMRLARGAVVGAGGGEGSGRIGRTMADRLRIAKRWPKSVGLVGGFDKVKRWPLIPEIGKMINNERKFRVAAATAKSPALAGLLRGRAETERRIIAAYVGYARKPDPFDVLFAKGGLVKGPYSKPLALALGGVFDSATPAIIGEAGREVVIPLSRPNRALQLARESGLIDVLAAGARAQSSTTAGTVAAGPDTAGPFRGGPGNTYNIYGVTMDQIIAEIEARDSAALRVRR